MPEKADLLLVGFMFGAAEARLGTMFRVHRIEDFAQAHDLPAETAGKRASGVRAGPLGEA